MPFVRFSRDKKGYEHVYLMHSPQVNGRSLPPRVLYWYRTPPGVKVGRQPFDPSVRRALEAQYPNVEFDWKRIVSTPMPPPEAESWRERRRADRAVKQARAAEPRVPGGRTSPARATDARAAEARAAEGRAGEARAAEARAAAAPRIVGDAREERAAGEEGTGAGPARMSGAPDEGEVDAVAGEAKVERSADDVGGAPHDRRRRRRRGGRRHRKPHPTSEVSGATDVAALPEEPARGADEAAGANDNHAQHSPDSDADAFDEPHERE